MEVESLQRREEEDDFEEEHQVQNNQIYIENDKKYHQTSSMMCLALLENEIKQVIGSTMSSNETNEDVKQYLEAKRKELEGVHKKLLNMFSGGQLDSNKYLQVIEKMKVVNTGLIAQLQAENKNDDLLRVQQRLDILNNEYQSYQEKIKQEMNIEEEEKKTDQKVQKNNMTASTFFSKIDKLSPQALAKILEKRIPQYWALANYLNEQIAPSITGKEKKAIEERLQSYFYPLITQANQYQQELEKGNKTLEAVRFIRKEMLDMSPELLHGKTLEERREDLKLLMDEIEDCYKEETEYMDILKTAAEDPSQTLAVIKNKYKDAHLRTQKYQEYIELLSKLGSEKYAWVPTPKVLVSKEQRLVNLVNNEVSANAMQVIFKRLGNIVPGHYWIRWTIETQDGYRMFETDYCDSTVMSFDYNEMVEMTSKTKLDSTIEKKEINIEVLYKKLRILNEIKYAEGSISLAEFGKTNTVEGKLKLKDAEGKENCELHYLLKIRHPITKTTRIEVKTVHSFQTFTAFNPSQQTTFTKPVATSSNVQAKPNESFAVPQKPTNMIIESPPQKPQQQQQQPKAAPGGGLFSKLVYPPLVLLKQDKDPLGSLQAHEVPAGITLEEIMNPLDPDNIVSITVLKTLVPLLENSRGKLAEEGRRADNKFIGDIWSKALKKVMILEVKFGEGEIDPNEYLSQLKNTIVKDKRAKEFYEQRQDQARLAFIKEKLPIVEKEIQELEDALAQSEE